MGAAGGGINLKPADYLLLMRPQSRRESKTMHSIQRILVLFSLAVTVHSSDVTQTSHLRRAVGAWNHTSRQLNDAPRPCAMVTTTVDITEDDHMAFAVRVVEVLQHVNHNIHFFVQAENTLTDFDMFKRIATARGVRIIDAGMKIIRVPRITPESVSGYCSNILLQVHFAGTPMPTFQNIANHGIYVPMIKDFSIMSKGVFGRNTKKMWLGYDQIWLPAWNLLSLYNEYVLPIIDFAMKGETQSLWPLVNSVVVKPGAPGNKIFVDRTHVLIFGGMGESKMKKHFQRIKHINTPIPTPAKSPSRFAAIIYEGRIHFALRGVCNNVMSSVSPKGEWDMHLLHSNANEAFVKKLFEGKPGVFLHNSDSAEISIGNYNSILTGNPFWRMFEKYERVLIFQTDSIFLRNMNPAHLVYDYIGAPWCLERNPPAEVQYKRGVIKAEDMVSVGNGGFSIRNPQAMLRCINEYATAQNVKPEDFPEDMFFVICMTSLGMSIAPPTIARDFAIEQTPCRNQDDRSHVINLNTTALHAAWVHSEFRHGEFDQILTRYENLD